jgi:excisionase family DNA binding protein
MVSGMVQKSETSAGREITPELLTTAQAAQLLGLSESFMFALVRTGRFGPKPVRVGRAVRYLRSELLAWARTGADLGGLPNRARWEHMRGTAGSST